MRARSIHGKLVLATSAFALVLMGCGSGSSSESSGDGVHTVPGSAASVQLPATWNTIDTESSDAEIEEFQRAHPRFLDVGDILRSPVDGALVAAVGKGDVRLLVTVRPSEEGVTLGQHVQENLQGMENSLRQYEFRFEGPREEIVGVGGEDAWRLRWSYKGDLGRIQIVQYTLIRDGSMVNFTFSTLGPWSEAEMTFEGAAATIRFGEAVERSAAATGMVAFYREGDDDATDIYTVPAAGGEETRLTQTGKDSSPAWSPDGERIAYVSQQDGNAEIYVMRADGSERKRLTDRPGSDEAPSWSPDGQRILFTSESGDDTFDLFLMDADGSDVQRLTDDGQSGDGSFSPDGKRIVFWSGRDQGKGVYVMDADGSGARWLTSRFETSWGGDWSPDNDAIVFVGSGHESNPDDDIVAIYRMSPDGSDVERLATARGYWVDEPEWSPDGESIAFFGDGEGPGAIWLMDADGKRQRPLTHTGDSHGPSWVAP